MTDKPFGNATADNLDRMADSVLQAASCLGRMFAIWTECDIPSHAWTSTTGFVATSYPFEFDLQEQMVAMQSWAEAIRDDAERLRRSAPPPIYVVYAGNALALDESGRCLRNAPVDPGGTVQHDEWTEVNLDLLPEETNEALRRIFGALLTLPHEIPPP